MQPAKSPGPALSEATEHEQEAGRQALNAVNQRLKDEQEAGRKALERYARITPRE
jgi:hypothetical protein